MRQTWSDGAQKVFYLHGDHLGSTNLTTDSNGARVSECRYYPYGQERDCTGEDKTDFGFTGQRNEGSFGLMDYNARYYSPRLGRFVSADSIVPNPLGSQGWNRYMYVNNNPIQYIDPTGHFACDDTNGHCLPESVIPQRIPDIPDDYILGYFLENHIPTTPYEGWENMWMVIDRRNIIYSAYQDGVINDDTYGNLGVWDMKQMASGGISSEDVMMGVIAAGVVMGGGKMMGNTGLFYNQFPEDQLGQANLVPGNRLKEISGRFNYVVLENEELLVGKGGHIDLAKGAPVMAAGEVKVVNGSLIYMDNASGHYQPTGVNPRLSAENAFSSLGFDITGKYIPKVWVSDPSLPRGGAWRVEP